VSSTVIDANQPRSRLIHFVLRDERVLVDLETPASSLNRPVGKVTFDIITGTQETSGRLPAAASETYQVGSQLAGSRHEVYRDPG